MTVALNTSGGAKPPTPASGPAAAPSPEVAALAGTLSSVIDTSSTRNVSPLVSGASVTRSDKAVPATRTV